MGHYSNPAPELAGDKPSEHIRRVPPPNQPHRAQRQLRADDVDALVEHYRAGETIIQLAGRYGINRTTVIAHLDRRGVERRAISKQWDHETLTSVARSYADGSSLADIAAQFGLNPSTIANRLRRAGIPIRPRQGWKY